MDDVGHGVSRFEFGDKFEAILKGKNPKDALRSFAIELSEKGLKRDAIYSGFHGFYEYLRSSDRQEEEDLMGDVMDMIMDEYPPLNLNLPN